MKTSANPPIYPTVARGGSVPDRVFDEVHGLYPGSGPGPGQKLTHFQGRSTDLEGRWLQGEVCDLDRTDGSSLQTGERRTLLMGRRVTFEVTRPDGKRERLPSDLESVFDVALDARHGRVAASHTDPASGRRVVSTFDLNEPPGYFSTAQGQIELRENTEAVEFDAQGRLLVARENSVQLCDQGQLQPYLEFPGKVQDINTLSDQGLCIRVATPNYAGYALYYLAPESQQPVKLAHSAVGPIQIEQSAEFIQKFSSEEREKFLEDNSGWNPWWARVNGKSMVDCPAPQGNATVAFHPQENRFYARSGTQDLGEIHWINGGNSHNLHFRHGVDPSSACWSQDGRLFAVCSQAPPDWDDSIRDAWVWDSQTRTGQLIPQVHSVETIPEGHLLVHGPKGQNHLLRAEDLSTLREQDWYQKALLEPMVSNDFGHLDALSRDGSRSEIPDGFKDLTSRAVADDGSFFLGFDPEGRGKLWDLTSQMELNLPGGPRYHWDSHSHRLGVVHPDGHQHSYDAAQFRQSDLYARALAEKIGGVSPVVAPVSYGKQGATVGGLTMPRPKSASTRPGHPT